MTNKNVSFCFNEKAFTCSKVNIYVQWFHPRWNHFGLQVLAALLYPKWHHLILKLWWKWRAHIQFRKILLIVTSAYYKNNQFFFLFSPFINIWNCFILFTEVLSFNLRCMMLHHSWKIILEVMKSYYLQQVKPLHLP